MGEDNFEVRLDQDGSVRIAGRFHRPDAGEKVPSRFVQGEAEPSLGILAELNAPERNESLEE